MRADAKRGIGITGHIHLKPGSAWLIRRELACHLRGRPRPLHGLTCLAPGADQIFAEVIRELGGTYDVIMPARGYRDRALRGRERRRFDELVAGARQVFPADLDYGDPEAYAAANAHLVSRCDELIAVWDGVADHSPGSTAHTVTLARVSNVPCMRVWPIGAERSPRPIPVPPLWLPRSTKPLVVGSTTS